jgi:archaellum biogenesis protein FlaJ (TadC family)
MISPLTEFREIYNESGIPLLFREYMLRAAIILSVVFSLSVITTYSIHTMILQVTGNQLIIAVSVLSLSITLMATILVLFYPINKKNEMTKKIDNGLLYTLGYMTVLSASGLGIETIMERVAEVEDNQSIKQLASKFVMNMRLFGMDIKSSLEDVATRSASDTLKYVIESINNNIQTSGELKNLFKYEVDRLMQRKRDDLKKVLNSLTYLGELYVALLVVAPILFILIVTILSILGTSASSGSVLQLNLITFLGMPLLSTMFIIILDTTMGGEE